MKNKTSFTIDILLCITLISSLFYCLVTSFDIKTEWYIIVVPTAIFCTIYGLLASLVKKSGVLFISVAITMIVFVFTLLFSLESILEQLSYVYYSGFKTAFAISSRTEQNHFGRYPRHKRNRTFCVYFGNTECSFYNQPDTIQAYFDSVIAVNGTARPLLHSCKHSSVARLSFIAIASLIALYISKNTRKFRPSQGGVIAAISFGTMLVVMAILLAFNPTEKI